MILGYLAHGIRYGTTHHLTKPKHPRKQLLQACGRESARKMYCNTKDGKSRHVGYIVAGEWYEIHEVHDWKGETHHV